MTSIRHDRVREMAAWLNSIPPEPPFGERPDFDRFRDLSRDEFAAVGDELMRAAALDLALTDVIEGRIVFGREMA